MSKFAKVLRGLAALAIAAGLGTLIGWLVSRQGDVAPIATPPMTNQSLAVASPPPAQPPDSNHLIVMPKPAPSRGITHRDLPADWEQRLEDILLGEDDDNGKADKILALISGELGSRHE